MAPLDISNSTVGAAKKIENIEKKFEKWIRYVLT